MNKLVAMYLAIRTPLLWISFFIFLISPINIVAYIALSILIFTTIFSEDSYCRYKSYRNGTYKEKEKSFIDIEI